MGRVMGSKHAVGHSLLAADAIWRLGASLGKCGLAKQMGINCMIA